MLCRIDCNTARHRIEPKGRFFGGLFRFCLYLLPSSGFLSGKIFTNFAGIGILSPTLSTLKLENFINIEGLCKVFDGGAKIFDGFTVDTVTVLFGLNFDSSILF